MFTTRNAENLNRGIQYSNELKELLQDELVAQKYVEWMTIPGGAGSVLQIPMIGDAVATDYVEDQAVNYTSLDTGTYNMTFDGYVQSGHYITEKAKQDIFWASRVESMFVPKQHRAIMTQLEDLIMRKPNDEQTKSDYNLINGARHRWVAQGTNDQLTAKDFAQARFSLKKANMPDSNLVAIVDASFEAELDKLTANHLFSTSPRGESLIEGGVANGMNFVINLFGFDIYTNQRLVNGVAETIDGNTVANGAANMFFSADKAVTPWVGSWIQQPKVDIEFNKDYQRTEYVTTARYGVGIQREENMVIVLSDTEQVYS